MTATVIRGLGGVVLCLCLFGCGDDQHDVAGPGIDVHCAALTPVKPGVGDTSVKVTCPPQT